MRSTTIDSLDSPILAQAVNPEVDVFFRDDGVAPKVAWLADRHAVEKDLVDPVILRAREVGEHAVRAGARSVKCNREFVSHLGSSPTQLLICAPQRDEVANHAFGFGVAAGL